MSRTEHFEQGQLALDPEPPIHYQMGYEPEHADHPYSRIVREGRPAIRFPNRYDIINDLSSGSKRFKSQFETADSEGNYDPDLRAQAEHELHGYEIGGYRSVGTPDKDRPISGYVDQGPEPGGHAVRQYGEVKAILKPKVRDRATVTHGDSLDEWYHAHNSPGATGEFMPAGWHEAAEGRLGMEHFKSPGGGPADYIEAQYHGRLKRKAIDHIELYHGHEDESTGGHAQDVRGEGDYPGMAVQHLKTHWKELADERYEQNPLPGLEDTKVVGGHTFIRNQRVSKQFRVVGRSPGFKSQYWGPGAV